MEHLQRASVLLQLNEELRRVGSWAGETHMQKAGYFLQHLMNIPLGFEFILYKHGPFSFDLRDGLTAMRAQGFLRLEPQYPYGPSLAPGENSTLLRSTYKAMSAQYEASVRYVADVLGNKTVAQLERTATALYVTLEGTPIQERARQITQLKPHVTLEEAQAAVAEVDEISRNAATFRPEIAAD
jgi:uncharacterized protein YwgA